MLAKIFKKATLMIATAAALAGCNDNWSSQPSRPGTPLTADEYALITGIFGNQIDSTGLRKHFDPDDNGSVQAMTTGPVDIIFYKDYHAGDYSCASVTDFGLFMHEMLHIWQYQNNQSTAERDYEYTLRENSVFSDYGCEQQAAIVQDYARSFLHPAHTPYWIDGSDDNLRLLKKLVEDQFPHAQAFRLECEAREEVAAEAKKQEEKQAQAKADSLEIAAAIAKGELWPGQLVPDQGIYMGKYYERNYEHGTIIKAFNIFAAPQDLTDSAGCRLLLTYRDAVKRVDGLKNWHGFDGIGYTDSPSDKDELYQTPLSWGKYKGEWFIPPREMVDGKYACGLKLYKRPVGTFLQYMDRGALKDAFGNSGYWTCTEAREWDSDKPKPFAFAFYPSTHKTAWLPTKPGPYHGESYLTVCTGGVFEPVANDSLAAVRPVRLVQIPLPKGL